MSIKIEAARLAWAQNEPWGRRLGPRGLAFPFTAEKNAGKMQDFFWPGGL